MSISVVAFIVGAVFLALGLIGGGIKIGVKEGEASIPPLNPRVRVLASIIGAGFVAFSLWREVNPPESILPITTPATVSTQVPTSSPITDSTTTESTGWAFTLEYRFPAGFWSRGTHSYSFGWICPNEAPDSVTRDFTVSDNFPLISDIVYLRWSSLRVGSPWGESVEGINPSQPTVASMAWDSITKSEAEWRASNCTGTISWDGGAIESLTPRPFER